MSGHYHASSRGREVYSHVLTDSKGQVQNVKAARVYVFGNDDIVEDEDVENVVFEMPEMRSRRGQADAETASPRIAEQELFLEKEIGNGETLQSLSLKYSCPMSDLKRINNLIKEQDFYALRILKIPMRRHGILSEMDKQQEQVHNGGSIPSDSDVCSDVDFSDPETQLRVMRTVSIRDNFSQQGREVDRFLKKMDKDLQKFRESQLTHSESLDHVVSMLSNRSIYPLQQNRGLSNGADCGIRLWVVIAVAVCLAVFVPTFYFLVYEYKHDELSMESTTHYNAKGS